MCDDQVSYKLNKNSQNSKIRSAIDLLLAFDSVEVTEPTVKLTECSPEVDVVINKQGGICTRCNRMFKSRTSLIGHLEKCHNIEGSISRDKESDMEKNDSNIIEHTYTELNTPDQIQTVQPRLIIVSQR